jgi:hypothetical protein
MLKIFIYSLIISILFTPFGVFFIGNQRRSLYLFAKELIYGLIVLSFLAILVNFFYPLNIYVNSIILLFFLIIFIKYKEYYFNFRFLIFAIILSFLITLLITESNVYRPDAGLYHLPFIGILNSEKIIIGLSNLHFRYGHTSVIQHLSAISNNLIFKNNGIVYAQAILAAAVIINFVYQIYNYNRNKIYNFHFFYLLFVFIYIFYKMNRYGEYGNDAPAHFLVFFLISEIILYKDKIKQSEFLNHLILTLFIIQSKSILIVAVLLNLINLKKINLKYVVKEKKFFFLMFFFIIWILKNILTSGCAIYPLKFTCFKNLSWVDINKIENISKSSEAWSKGISNLSAEDRKKFSNLDDYLKNFTWITTWSNIHLKHILNLQIPYITLCLIILCIIKFRSKNKNIKIDKFYYNLIIILFICSFAWFIKAPLYRYGYSFPVSFFSLIFALTSIKSNLNTRRIYILCNVLLIFGISGMFTKNIIRIFNNDNNYNNYPWPKYYSMGEDNLMVNYYEEKLGYKKILVPIQNGNCMYIKNICSHYHLDKNLNIKNLKGYDIIYFNYK